MNGWTFTDITAVWEKYTLHTLYFLFLFLSLIVPYKSLDAESHLTGWAQSRFVWGRHTQTHTRAHMKWRNLWVVQQLGSHDTLLTELSQALLKRLKVCVWVMVRRLRSPTDALSSNPLVFTKTLFARLFLCKLSADFNFLSVLLVGKNSMADSCCPFWQCIRYICTATWGQDTKRSCSTFV